MIVFVLKGLRQQCSDVFATDPGILTALRLAVAVVKAAVKARFVSVFVVASAVTLLKA